MIKLNRESLEHAGVQNPQLFICGKCGAVLLPGQARKCQGCSINLCKDCMNPNDYTCKACGKPTSDLHKIFKSKLSDIQVYCTHCDQILSLGTIETHLQTSESKPIEAPLEEKHPGAVREYFTAVLDKHSPDKLAELVGQMIKVEPILDQMHMSLKCSICGGDKASDQKCAICHDKALCMNCLTACICGETRCQGCLRQCGTCQAQRCYLCIKKCRCKGLICRGCPCSFCIEPSNLCRECFKPGSKKLCQSCWHYTYCFNKCKGCGEEVCSHKCWLGDKCTRCYFLE